MNSCKVIGGFFELDLPDLGFRHHPNALALSNGRSCIKYVLNTESPNKVYLPTYTCSSVISAIKSTKIPIKFYDVDEKLDFQIPKIDKNDLLIVINYFGLHEDKIELANKMYQNRLLVDNTHSYFRGGYNDSYFLTSARKHFGIPDGAFLYGPSFNDSAICRNKNVSLDHNVLRFNGNLRDAYLKYKEEEKKITTDILGMSNISRALLRNISFIESAKKRFSNYQIIHQHLSKYNVLKFSHKSPPIFYPLLLNKKMNKSKFHSQGIFIPTIWPESHHPINKMIGDKLLPIPIDHRYDHNDMIRIIKSIKKELDV